MTKTYPRRLWIDCAFPREGVRRCNSTLKTYSPIRRVSSKRRRQLKSRREIWVPMAEELHWRCPIKSPVCTGRIEGPHHIKKLSALGKDEPSNIIPCCNACNDWIENNPDEARERGLVVKSWEGGAA